MPENLPIYIRDPERIKSICRTSQKQIFRRIHKATDGYTAASLACLGASFMAPYADYLDIPGLFRAASVMFGIFPALYWSRGIYEATILEIKCNREIRRVKSV